MVFIPRRRKSTLSTPVEEVEGPKDSSEAYSGPAKLGYSHTPTELPDDFPARIELPGDTKSRQELPGDPDHEIN